GAGPAEGEGPLRDQAGDLLKGRIPIKTFSEWDDATPRFCQADLAGWLSNRAAAEAISDLHEHVVCWHRVPIHRGSSARERRAVDARRQQRSPSSDALGRPYPKPAGAAGEAGIFAPFLFEAVSWGVTPPGRNAPAVYAVVHGDPIGPN